MAQFREFKTQGTKSGQGTRVLRDHISGYDFWESSGAASALVRIRDMLALSGAPVAADNVAGLVEAGIHYYGQTWVTPWGESQIGVAGVINSAGTVKILVTPPLYVNTQFGGASGVGQRLATPIVGRRLYRTKTGAPGAATAPTSAQWFRVVADPSNTTVGAGSNGQVWGPLNTDGTTLTVAATAGYQATGNLLVATTTFGPIIISYTAIGSGTTFTGCRLVYPDPKASSLTGQFTGPGIATTTGDVVSQPMIGDNVTPTYLDNIADASLVNTRPPTVDQAGEFFHPGLFIPSGGSVGVNVSPFLSRLMNDGGVYVEVVNGAISYSIRGA